MTAIAGVAGPWPRDALARFCAESLNRQSLYARLPPKCESAEGACFGAALFPTTPQDLADRQPLKAASILLVADARVDNRAELIAELGPSALPDSPSDSDLILAGWLRWTHRFFDRLIGSFAVAIHDSETRRVVLARSPTFDRPLCYRLDEEVIRFASMPSGIAGAQFIPDLPALAKLMVNGDLDPSETAFAGIRQVLPGHYLEWTAAGHRVARFWSPPEVDRGYRGDSVEELRHLLDLAVEARLARPGGRVATHLSAGFDSSAVTATAARLIADPSDLVAFTAIPSADLAWAAPAKQIADERAGAGEVAQRYGIEHRLVSGSGSLLSSLSGHGRYFQAPVPNVPNSTWGEAIDREAARAGATVLLSATRGNANISYGGIDLLSEWLRRLRLLDYLRQVRSLVRNNMVTWRGAIFYSIDEFVPSKIWNRIAGYTRASAKDLFIRPEWLNSSESTHCEKFRNLPGLRRIQYDIFANGDLGIFTKGTLAKSGFDERDPAADIRLAEFALRLPPEHFIGGGMTRRLARVALTDRLPQSIIDHRRRGYQGADWFARMDRDEARNWVEDISASSWATQILNLPELRRTVSDLPDEPWLDPNRLRQWGGRFTRALAVGSFLLECEREPGRIGTSDQSADLESARLRT